MSDTLAIAEFIKTHKEELAGIGYEYAATFLNNKKVIARTITKSNIKSIEAALGFDFITMHNKSSAFDGELLDRIEKLEKTVAALCVALGYPN